MHFGYNMYHRLDIAYTTMAAELLDRSLDAQFDEDFDEAGSFIKVKSRGRDYWYYKPSLRGGQQDRRVYVGPADDLAITTRVEKFRELKSDFQARRKIVSTLTREARLFAPEPRVGDVLEGLWKAGAFRLRACLVGTIAYQTYGTVLGYRLAGQALQTGDIDLAQFHSVSVSVDDSMPDILSILKELDATFRPAPTLQDQFGTTRFVASSGLRVEFLTPNTSKDDYTDKPALMPALGGAAAQPLRFLDFLIHNPVRAVVLYKGGIPVLVPEPARFAVHKLIVASRRVAGTGKSDKDLLQAAQLAEALVETGRKLDLRESLGEARSRGPAWQAAIDASISRLPEQGLRAFDL